MSNVSRDAFTDVKGKMHAIYHLTKTKNKKGKLYRKARFCQKCRIETGKQANTSYLCLACNKPYCLPLERNGQKRCFEDHVDNCGPFAAAKK